MADQKIENLVVGLDLSTYSKVIVREAKALAKQYGVKPVYVYVFENTSIFDSKFDYKRNQVTQYYTKEMQKKLALTEDEVVVRFGRPADQVIAEAKARPKSMILVGHRGMSPIGRLFIGSTAEKIALKSPVPVWVHRGEKVVMPKKILIPVDFSSRSDRAVSKVSVLNKTLKSSVELYHVMQQPMPVLDYSTYAVYYNEMKKIDDQGVSKLKKKFPKMKIKTAVGNIIYEIGERSKGFNVVALSPRTESKKAPFFGGVTAKLIRNSDKPVLVLP